MKHVTLYQAFEPKLFPYPNDYIIGDYPEDNGMEAMQDYLEENTDIGLAIKWGVALQKIKNATKLD